MTFAFFFAPDDGFGFAARVAARGPGFETGGGWEWFFFARKADLGDSNSENTDESCSESPPPFRRSRASRVSDASF